MTHADLHTEIFGHQPIPVASTPSSEQGSDAMDSFDQFMSMVPNLSTPATSFNGQQPDNAYPNKGFQEIDPPNGASDTLTAVERRQHKNKVAQKRFRERQKVRSHEIEAEFAATTAELRELKTKQKALEARNLLLEKLVKLNKQKPALKATTLPEKLVEADELPSPLAQEVQSGSNPGLTLTIRGKPQVIPLHEISKLSFPDFAKLYSEYTTQLAHCLMELQEASNCTVQQQLQAWILEVHFLHVAFAVRLPSRLKEVTSLRYDDYQLCPEQSSEFYDSLLTALEFTDRQILDLLYLRQLLFCKQGQMMRERNALLAKMAGNELEQMHFASDKIAELAEWPEQLSKNGVAEYCCYREFCFAFWTGILTAQQSAKAMVYAYPFPAQPEVMLNQLAADREEPSMQALLDDTSVDDFQHDANWQDLSRYLASITMQNVQAHVPLLSE